MMTSCSKCGGVCEHSKSAMCSQCRSVYDRNRRARAKGREWRPPEVPRWIAKRGAVAPPEYWRAMFQSKVSPEPTSGCWLWTGSLTSEGYGDFGYKANRRLAHIYSYELAKGPVPDGLELDHKCRVRSCCNPNHLEPVTHQINTLRGIGPTAKNAMKTHCPKGHAYDEENTRISASGKRDCRMCDRLNMRAKRAALRECARS